MRETGDQGRPIVLSDPASPSGRVMAEIAGHLARRVSIQTLGAT